VLFVEFGSLHWCYQFLLICCLLCHFKLKWKSKALKKTNHPTQAYNNKWTLLLYCKKGRFSTMEKTAELSSKFILLCLLKRWGYLHSALCEVDEEGI